ncbi:tRNA (adenosine(37)-N6)-threonylcarbamoyltransferase complex dimerization subunit type 1 TsaB [Demequina muriae]|uniref:tRNA (Adenosine(37)-N6)-threonylcarbamoyltransferase complex dimerization subunit type 1 TsaB n=1 Tax=Demequina muriae TaxID=3051664 RepID=A0ABT8GHY2_9MICO|nr:tRNA (adenosine(37)-N6)-threonylcarbamoyltransferase complex dimerization subunit type 1 TsaB [Demequina sp. EGI L300058]MDN4480874.1 tRNA (adenosine(37)-N6)-threonylcarbamoyltransferase complex dimerization subunit type 1 TsaB [Demequina sp. EGI L300058]
MILALDTSAAVAVSVVDGDRVVASRSEFAPRGHAELLTSLIRDAMAEAGVTGADLESIVVGTGPAPFTGLRVGLVTARTLAFAWGVPAHGVCSLDALGAEHGDVTVIADARRKEVYWARYRDGRRMEGPEVGSPESVSAPGIVVGRGALLYPDAFPHAVGGDPDPAWLARVARERLASGETDLPLEPMYLRRPDVHGVPGA